MSEAETPAMKGALPTEPSHPDGTKHEHVEGLAFDVSGEEQVDAKLAAIEMAGEEVASGFKPQPHVPLSPEVRYLHFSRTIHQLVTDRNRAVGIFLFVASVLIGASSALLNAHPRGEPIVPLAAIQFWCLPITFGTLAVIALFTSLILIRTRIGLIFEVAKMNALLGLPSERVKRVNPLSIFYLMHLLVVVLGAACAGLTAGMLGYRSAAQASPAIGLGLVTAFVFLLVLQAIYYVTISHTTSDTKLQDAGR
ncbi:MAG TPA: hypothetical protein VGZ22_11085 [Isosphaeraceae bacterium]|jgi:hypothetical protein|nr:hypothetical protein [Isosphaeraceae bacterium]